MRDVTRAVRAGALSVASALATLAVIVLADRFIVSRFVPADALIFSPHDEYRYRTSEFSAVAHANAMGFRDREFSPEAPPGVTRILAIGDSFTYGWGVEDDEAWPKVLERRLVAAGERVEIANMGEPGADPAGYAALAQNAIPRLRPALIIVAVLQGDDLAQVVADRDEPRGTDWKSVVRALIPHLLTLRARWRGDVADHSTENHSTELIWKKQAEQELAQYTPKERARFAALNDDVKRAFLSGNLNPGFMGYVVQVPNRLVDVDDLESATARFAIARMGGHLAAIRRVASAYRSDMIVVGVPFGPYASLRDYRNAEHVGVTLVPDMPSSMRADEAIRRASEQAGVPFVSVAAGFRKSAATRELFFVLDGHYTRAGNDVFASLVEPAVAARMSQLRHAVR